MYRQISHLWVYTTFGQFRAKLRMLNLTRHEQSDEHDEEASSYCDLCTWFIVGLNHSFKSSVDFSCLCQKLLSLRIFSVLFLIRNALVVLCPLLPGSSAKALGWPNFQLGVVRPIIWMSQQVIRIDFADKEGVPGQSMQNRDIYTSSIFKHLILTYCI